MSWINEMTEEERAKKRAQKEFEEAQLRRTSKAKSHLESELRIATPIVERLLNDIKKELGLEWQRVTVRVGYSVTYDIRENSSSTRIEPVSESQVVCWQIGNQLDHFFLIVYATEHGASWFVGMPISGPFIVWNQGQPSLVTEYDVIIHDEGQPRGEFITKRFLVWEFDNYTVYDRETTIKSCLKMGVRFLSDKNRQSTSI